MSPTFSCSEWITVSLVFVGCSKHRWTWLRDTLSVFNLPSLFTSLIVFAFSIFGTIAGNFAGDTVRDAGRDVARDAGWYVLGDEIGEDVFDVFAAGDVRRDGDDDGDASFLFHPKIPFFSTGQLIFNVTVFRKLQNDVNWNINRIKLNFKNDLIDVMNSNTLLGSKWQKKQRLLHFNEDWMSAARTPSIESEHNSCGRKMSFNVNVYAIDWTQTTKYVKYFPISSINCFLDSFLFLCEKNETFAYKNEKLISPTRSKKIWEKYSNFEGCMWLSIKMM